MDEVAATPDQARVDALLRSAAQVRADQPEVESGTRSWRRFAITAVYSVALGGLALAAVHAAGDATPVRADGGADGALFSLTNQDRASNGVRSLNGNGSLAAIAEAGRQRLRFPRERPLGGHDPAQLLRAPHPRLWPGGLLDDAGLRRALPVGR